MMTALRGYLRFLAAHGVCQPWLDRAVPAIPQWRLSALPRYLPTPDVERLITSCDLTKPHGIRDKAILLLLARLGLRAGDIRGMRLSDVEWNEGALRYAAKAGGRSGYRCRKTLATPCSITWNGPGPASTMTECSCGHRRRIGPSRARAPSPTWSGWR